MDTKEPLVETYTIKDLRKFKPSRALMDILKQSEPSVDFESRLLITPETFFNRALYLEGLDETAASAFRELFGPGRSRQHKYKITNDDTAVSLGLYQAFQGASELRAQTSGKDAYIGLRHVLFALATSNIQPLHDDVEDIFSATNVSRPQAIKTIASYCLDYAEEEENQDVWNKILGDLGLKRDELGVEAAVPLRADEIAVLQADDPWSETAIDRSGAGNEAEAFAAMICARQFSPPLAVGVFGDWGSGKSFFMKLVHQAINRRTKRVGANERTADGKENNNNEISFLKHIVQIRFNAWHYAETNLWASLVDNIFTSLDDWARKHNSISETGRVFRKLTSSKKQTVEAVKTLVKRRQEEHDARARLRTAEQELADKRSRLEAKPATFARTAWDQVFKKEAQKTRMKQAAKTLGLGEVGDGVEDLASAVMELDGELERFEVLRSGVVRSLVLPVAAAAVVVSLLVLPPLFAFLADRIHDGLSPIAAAISGVFAPLALALTWAARKTQNAIGVVTDFRARFERQIEERSTKQREKKKQAQVDMATAQAAAEEAQNALAQAVRKTMDAARNYHEQTDEGRVLRFVRDRVMGGQYAKQLSFTATVRKDFDELSRLMHSERETEEAREERQLIRDQIASLLRKNRKHLTKDEIKSLCEIAARPQKPVAVFQRIVLFIDDLDRCPPDQVINVLQAIHLLLNFPLFVVFVAVDVRWLRNSLTTKYKDLLGGGNGAEGMATPSDYLEKIFQVPYWVRAMESDATREILIDLMGPAHAPSRNTADTSLPDEIDQPWDKQGKKSDQPEPASGVEPDKPVSAPPDQQSAVSLDLTTEERAFIEEIAETLDGSPRRTLRFINSYRIIKASLDDNELATLEARGFAALATLLAISVSADEAYPLIVSALTSGKVKNTAALKQLFDEADALSGLATSRIRESLDRLDRQGFDWALMKQYSKTVARFAFHRANGAMERVDAPLA